MNKHLIRTIHEAFLYATDCQLATVSSMAMIKSRKKGEYQRQIGIAQFHIDSILCYFKDDQKEKIDGRIRDVIEHSERSVEKWAKSFEE